MHKQRTVLSVLAVSLFVSITIALASGQPPQHTDYVLPDQVKSALASQSHQDLPSLGNGQWIGNVFVLPYAFGGSYDKDLPGGELNITPREWVARSFYQANADNYDFLLVVTNFDFQAGSELAFYLSVQNDVQGIGLEQFDYSDAFGSQSHKLQGFVDAKTIAHYRREDGSVDQDLVNLIFSHEIGHRWLAHVRFIDPATQTPSTALLGQEGAHWSYLLDSDASYMYGSNWRENGDGSFTATDILQKFSALDLYLMGLGPKESVAPMTLLQNSNVDPTQLPRLGDTIEAQKRTITLDQVIAAEGARQPAYDPNGHPFRVALVFLVDSTKPVDSKDLADLEALRTPWQRSFFQKTGGHGLVELGPNSLPPTSGPGLNLPAAAAWLRQQAKSDGRWEDSAQTVVRDTAVATEALEIFGGQTDPVQSGLARLVTLDSSSTELLSVKAALLGAHGDPTATQIAGQLADLVNPAGGWGAMVRYAGDPVTTAQVARAFANTGHQEDALRAWTWLKGQQNTDGGWSWRNGGGSACYPTLIALMAASEALDSPQSDPSVSRAVAWLLAQQKLGGVGDSYPDVPQTALFLRVGARLQFPTSSLSAAASFLSGRQQDDGSWESSAYKTGLALSALAPVFQPDPGVGPQDLFWTPESPMEGDPVTFTLAVHNRGFAFLPAGVPCRWQILDPQTGNVLESISAELPEIQAGGFQTLTQPWTLTEPPGQYQIRFVIDPERQLPEANRRDDSVTVPFVIKVRPLVPDLALSSSALSATPPSLTTLPQQVTISGTLVNVGRSIATNAPVTVYDFDPDRGGAALGTVLVTVPAQGSAPFSIPVTLTQSRSYILWVVADPANTLGDPDRSNNSAQIAVPLSTNEDLAVVEGSFAADPATGGMVGQPLQLSVQVQNRGTINEAGIQVGFYYATPSDPSHRQLIQFTGLGQTLAPGATATASITWAPNTPGAPLTLYAIVDPLGIVANDHNRDNNTATISLPVQPSTLPNLAVSPGSIVFVPNPPLQGQSVEITGNVQNVSANDATAFAAELWLDEIGTDHGGTLLGHQDFSGLGHGMTATVSATVPINWYRERKVYLVADPGQSLAEFNETDNMAFQNLDVMSYPDLVVSGGQVTWSPAFPHAGQPIHFDVLVLNQGDQAANQVQVELLDSVGNALGSQTLTAIEGQGRASAAIDWDPGNLTGAITLGVRVNAGHTVPENNYTNDAVGFTVPVQSGDAYASNSYISPNGDGIQDDTTLYFRSSAQSVQVINYHNQVVRTIQVAAGAGQATWDGRDDAGHLVADGAYTMRAGNLQARVTVDTNLMSLGDHPHARLLEPHVPSSAPDTMRIASAIPSPRDGEVFLLEEDNHYPAVLPPQLSRFDGVETKVIGPSPADATKLVGADAGGDRFLLSDWSGSYWLVQYPGPSVQTLNPPQPGLEASALSPDGEWVFWTPNWNSGDPVLQRADDLAVTRTIPSEGNNRFCVNWSKDGRVAVVSLSGAGYQPKAYIFDLTQDVQPTIITLEDDAIFTETHVDFERNRLIWFDWNGPINTLIGGEDGNSKPTKDWLKNWPSPQAFSKSASLSPHFNDANPTMLRVFDLQNGASLKSAEFTPTDGEGWLNYATISPDGKALFHTFGPGESLRAYFYSFETGESVLVANAGGSPGGTAPPGTDWGWTRPTWSSFGKSLIEIANDWWGSGSDLPTLLSADNLLAELKTRSLTNVPGINLDVLACDMNFERYTLEYEDLANQSAGFVPIGSAETDPIYGEDWGTWLPPSTGRFIVRLTAYDKAGNSRSYEKVVNWNGENLIANLTIAPRNFSPGGSTAPPPAGVPATITTTTFRFQVLHPSNLTFHFLDKNKMIVRTMHVAADQIGPMSVTWDGRDDSGNVLSDGKYYLEYNGATWPVVIDSTSPTASFEISPNELRHDCDFPGGVDNLYVDFSYSLQDANLEYWAIQRKPAGGDDAGWVTILEGQDKVDPIEALEDAGLVAGYELRLVVWDRANNSTVIQRSRRDEQILFADSEPWCRVAQTNPCVFPDRPDIDTVGIGSELLTADSFVLHPYYDTLVFQNTVWGFDPARLRLEYRTAALGSTPAGPWQTGDITVATVEQERVHPDLSSNADCIAKGGPYRLPTATMRALYWDHPTLFMDYAYDVRLVATNVDGREIVSPSAKFIPEAPVTIRYLKTDQQGAHFLVTNLSSVGLTLQVEGRYLLDGSVEGCARSVDLPFGAQLAVSSGASVEEAVCGLDESYMLCPQDPSPYRLAGVAVKAMQGAWDRGISAPIPFSPLKVQSIASFTRSSCRTGPVMPLGLNITDGDQIADKYWYTPGKQVDLVVQLPHDRDNLAYTGYDLQINNPPKSNVWQTLASIENPVPEQPYHLSLDLSVIPEGSYVVRHHFRYQGEQGGLGSCPLEIMTIDRTPPQVSFGALREGQSLCPESGIQTVTLIASECSYFYLQLDGQPLTERRSKSDPPPPTVRAIYDVDLHALAAGNHTLEAEVTDRAGWSGCATLHFSIEAQPNVLGLQAQPSLFSPLNTMSKPVASTISFGSSLDSTYQMSISTVRNVSGSIVVGQTVSFPWDGRKDDGQPAPDGQYQATAVIHSPCGEEGRDAVSLELDATPPAIELSNPMPTQSVGIALNIQGIVSDRNFLLYKIQERSTNDCDTCWTDIATGTRATQKLEDSLGVWHTAGLPAGNYILRVYAADIAGNENHVDVPVTVIERPLIGDFSADPDLFSTKVPDRNVVHISYELIQDANVTLTVLDPAEVVVATLVSPDQVQPAGTHDLTWDGIVGGQALPDGMYTLAIRAEDPAGSLAPEQEKLVVALDSTPPNLETPGVVEGKIYGPPIAVHVTVDDAHPDSYKISLQAPDGTITKIKEGKGILSDEPITTLANVADGTYVLKMEAADGAGNHATLDRTFILDSKAPSVQITSPQDGRFFNGQEPAVLRGTIVSGYFQEYHWAYAPGANPVDGDFIELAMGTTLPQSGLTDIDWDLSAISDGPYTIRLTALDQVGRQTADTRTMIVDKTPPTVTITAPAAEQVITAPADVLGSVSDANLQEWTLVSTPLDGTAPEGGLSIHKDEPPASPTLATWNPLPADGRYRLTLTATDRAGNHAETSVVVTIALLPPGPPRNLVATVVNQRDVHLSWEPGDGPAPIGYNVYRGGARINSDPLPVPADIDPGLLAGTYSYTVRAVGLSGRESTDSNVAQAVIVLGGPIAYILTPALNSHVSGNVQVRGTALSELNFKEYRLSVRPVGSSEWTLIKQSTAPVQADVLGDWNTLGGGFEEGPYEIKLEAEDTLGGLSTASVMVTLDNTPPARPVLTSAILTGDNAITVTWTLDPPPADLAGFYLYRNGRLANAPSPLIGPQTPYLIPGSPYQDQNLPDGTYVYYVTAADTAGNESEHSNLSDPITIDLRRPHAVIIAPDASHRTFEGSTQVVAECEDQDVVGVQFQYKGSADPDWQNLGAEVMQRPYTVKLAPVAFGSYDVQAVARDAGGLDPAPSPVTLINQDMPPASPASLTARVNGGDVLLTWVAPSDPAGDLAGFKLYRDGNLITPTQLSKETLTYTDTGLDDNWYNYSISAVDAAGNESGQTYADGVWVYTPQWDYVTPVISDPSTYMSGQGLKGKPAELQAKDGSGVFQTVAQLPAGDVFELTDYALLPGMQVLRIVGYDQDGNRSKPSRPLVLVRHDPPAQPSQLTASVGGSDVSLQWVSPTDGDSSGFTVSRDGSVINENTSPLSFDPNTHQITASEGTPEQIAAPVDADQANGWAPSAVPKTGASTFWQWTWPDAADLQAVTLTWDPNTIPRNVDLDIQVNGEWMWWASYTGNQDATIFVDAGVRCTGLRVRLPGEDGQYNGYGCYCIPRLMSVQPSIVQRTQSPPLVDPGLAVGAYQYEAFQWNRWAQTSQTAKVIALVGMSPPAPPSNVRVTATANCGELNIAWNAPDPIPDGLTGYKLYKATSSDGPFQQVALVAAPGLTSIDSGLASGITYFYSATTLIEVGGTEVESALSPSESGVPQCTSATVPVITEPTVAGRPIALSSTDTTVGGTAVAGSRVHLMKDGTEVAVGNATDGSAGIPIELPHYIWGYPTLSADGSKAAYFILSGSNGSAAIVLVDLRTNVATTIQNGGLTPGYIAFNQDGSLLAYGNSGGSLFIYRTSDGTTTAIDYPNSTIYDTKFSPDGRYVAFTNYQWIGGSLVSSIILHDIAGNSDRTIVTETSYGSFGYRCPIFSPDGNTLLIQNGGMPVLVDVASGQSTPIPNGYGAYYNLGAFSADGQSIFYAHSTDYGTDGTWTLYKYDRASGSTTPISGDGYEFSAAWLGADALLVLRANGNGTMNLVQRNISSFTERVLISGLTENTYAWDELMAAPLLVSSSGIAYVPQGQALVMPGGGRGIFEFPSTVLTEGVNHFMARQEAAGATQDSLPIEINTDLSAYPDATVVSLSALPSYPVKGDSVVLGFTVANLGPAALQNCLVRLTRLDSNGISQSVFSQTVSLVAGQMQTLHYTWDTAGVTGDYQWIAEADPVNAIVEADETNNTRSLVVSVRDSRGLEVATTTDSPFYLPGNTVGISVSLFSNLLPSDTIVQTAIEGESGSLVASVDSRTLAAFGPGSTSYQVPWTIPDIYPGLYRVHVVATQNGQPPVEAFAPFQLLPQTYVTASVQTDSQTYVRGAVVGVSGRVANTGQSTLHNLTAVLKVTRADTGDLVALQNRVISALPSGSAVSISWSWPSGQTDAGLYKVLMDVRNDQDSTVATASSSNFTLTDPGLTLSGKLVLDAALVEPGTPVHVTATVTNSSSVALQGVQATINLVDPQTGAALQTASQTMDISSGASVSFEETLPTDSLAMQAYVVDLTASGTGPEGPFAKDLAHAGLIIEDRTPPVVALVSPQAALGCDSIQVSCDAADTASGVEKVWYTLDQDQTEHLLAIQSGDPHSGRYSNTWTLQPVDDGHHRITILAVDTKGNVSVPVPVDIMADSTPPLISLSAPDEGACAAAPVAAVFSAQDANLASVLAALNGQPYESGTPIVADGNYTLIVTAADACNHLSTITRHFNISSASPVVTIASPAEGSCAAVGVVPVIETAPTGLTVTATLNGQSYAVGTPVTAEGDYTLVASAVNSCGTASAPVTRHFVVDVTNPLVTLTGVENGHCYSTAVSVVFSATDAHLKSVSATLNGQPYTSGTPITQDGSYTVVVTAEDNCGHTASITTSFAVNATAPIVTITSPAEGACAAVGVVPVIETAPTGLTVTATLNGQPYTVGTPVTAEGDYTLVASAVNSCGTASAPVTRHFVIDVTPPVVTVNTPAEGALVPGCFTPDISGTDPHDVNWTLLLDGQPYSIGSAVTGGGAHTLQISASDRCGNATTPIVRHFTVDGGPVLPSISGHFAWFGCQWMTINGSNMVQAGNAPGSPSGFGGNVGSNGDITVNGNNLVNGDATPGPGKKVSITGRKTQVRGSTQPATSVVACDDPSVEAWAAAARAHNDNAQMPAGLMDSSGNFLMNGNKQATLPQGTYLVANFTINGNARLHVAGPVTIVCTGLIVLNGTGQVNWDGAPGNLVLVGSSSMPVDFNGTIRVSLRLYAPLAQVAVNGNVTGFGTLWGQQFTANGNVSWNRVRDTVTPVIHISQPADGVSGVSPQPDVRIDYSDPSPGSGISVSSFKLLLDGADVTASLAAGPCGASGKLSGPLAAGSHQLKAFISDWEGNSSQATSNFVVSAAQPVAGVTIQQSQGSAVTNVLYFDRYRATGVTLESWLRDRGTRVTTVTAACDMMAALRTGLYDVVVIHDPAAANDAQSPCLSGCYTPASACRGLSDEISAFVYERGGLLVVGDARDDRDCLLGGLAALGAKRTGVRLDRTEVQTAEQAPVLETRGEFGPAQSIVLDDAAPILTTPAKAGPAASRCDGVTSVTLALVPALPAGVLSVHGRVSTPLEFLDEESGGAHEAGTIDRSAGGWVNLAMENLVSAPAIKVTSSPGSSLPSRIHIEVDATTPGRTPRQYETWLPADCSLEAGTTFGSFTVLSVTRTSHREDQSVIESRHHFGLGTSAICGWDAQANRGSASWSWLADAFDAVRPHTRRLLLPGRPWPMTARITNHTDSSQYLKLEVPLPGGMLREAWDSPASLEPLAWEALIPANGDSRTTYWLNIPDDQPLFAVSAVLKKQVGRDWVQAAQADTVLEAEGPASGEAFQAILDGAGVLVPLIRGAQERQAMDSVFGSLRAISVESGSSPANDPCIRMHMTDAFEAMAGMDEPEAVLLRLRIAQLLFTLNNVVAPGQGQAVKNGQ